MSFITKRERVFDEFGVLELPSRNEGKLKAYASCTDARAWSHFGSDQSEHLMEIIKRNNDTCRMKYLPTDVIVNTLMITKNNEIKRLKRKIEQFEQMIAAYDDLDLSCEQKCEIATAHAAIKAANKELNDLNLDLDLSGFTEGIDSEGFQTGKSRGDEAAVVKFKGDGWTETYSEMETRSNQPERYGCDASTSAYDTRIGEIKDALICKDAKLSAMQNTMMVMENDICEPYCIYANIYTALEKIFGILCQNDKYKLYLELLSSGKDTRCLNIKGKIIYKLKLLEKFSVALIAPCTQDYSPEVDNDDEDYACYRADIITHVKTIYALTSSEPKTSTFDNKRIKLVADIMKNDEMNDVIDKESIKKLTVEEIDEDLCYDAYNIDTVNLNRLKNLQVNYDELMTCYENLKLERDTLKTRCTNYENLEKELEGLRHQLREYNLLWSEKEHYRKRSEELDNLKEQCLILSEETSNLEIQLKAEVEINNIKAITADELRIENVTLEQKLNDATIAFERENNTLQCRLKETECTIMCQEQQIKSLSAQLDRLLEQGHDHKYQDDMPQPIALLDEIESLKDQIKNLKDALFCNDEEKQQLHEQYQDKLLLINNLRMEIEDWNSSYEKTIQRNEYLEKYTANFQDEVHQLKEENKMLLQDVEEKSTAVANLMNVINIKSQEVNYLTDEIDKNKRENKELLKQLHDVRESFSSRSLSLENDKEQALKSLELARQESQKLRNRVKDYNEIIHNQDELNTLVSESNQLKVILENTKEENKKLQKDLSSTENNNVILLQEIQRLREINNYAVENFNKFKLSSEVNQIKSEILEAKHIQFEDLREQLHILKDSQEKLNLEKRKIESDLREKANDLDIALQSIQLSKKESEILLDKLKETENLNDGINGEHQRLIYEKNKLERDLEIKNSSLDNLLQSLNHLKAENQQLLQNKQKAYDLEQELDTLKKAFDELMLEKSELVSDSNNKTEEINNLYNTLESKIEENRELINKITILQYEGSEAKENFVALQNENVAASTTLNTIRKESAELIIKLKQYECIASEFETLRRTYLQMKQEKDTIEHENRELNSQNENLLRLYKDLEDSLIKARNDLISNYPNQNPYAEVVKEIEEMKQDKLTNQQKVRELLNKLDESEIIISNLGEEMMARDDKISILENHINALEDEVRKLQRNLADVVVTGEEIRDNSYQKIDQSLNKMKAHHSKATYNMKIELANLHNENSKHENQLSVTKLKSEESLKKIMHLQNEREIMITDIKELEVNSVGDSILSPDNCNVEDVLNSLDRIRKCIDAKNSKSCTLEQTILKVQTSSQLLLSKADEAKKIVEKEKQKIIYEKEEAIKERLNTEKQLQNLKQQLERQSKHDKAIIKDLEGEILNQKLIIDQINKSTNNYIAKLDEDLKSMQNMYENSIAKVDELQDQLLITSDENSRCQKIIERINSDFDRKSKEVAALRKTLDELQNKPVRSHEVQTVPYTTVIVHEHQNKSSQTEQPSENDEIDNTDLYKADTEQRVPVVNVIKRNTTAQEILVTELLPSNKPQSVNEVQILTANVDNGFVRVTNSYLTYKLKQLSLGPLEHYSIIFHDENSNLGESIVTDNLLSQSVSEVSRRSGNTYTSPVHQDSHLVDIYNRHSANTESSKPFDNIDLGSSTLQRYHSSTKFGLSNDVFEFESFENYEDTKMFVESTSDKFKDKDIFLIYKDSVESHTQNGREYDKEHCNINGQPEIYIEAVTKPSGRPKNYHKVGRTETNKHVYPKTEYFNQFDTHDEIKENEDESDKTILKIQLPKVEHDKNSDKKSLDSFTITNYSSEKPIALSNINIDDISDFEDTNSKGQHEHKILLSTNKRIQSDSTDTGKQKSHHELSRVGANFVLIKNKENNHEEEKDEKLSPKLQEAGAFGLNYILESVQHEGNPQNIIMYNAFRGLRKSHSEEMINSSPFKLSSIKISSPDHKTISSSSHDQRSQPKFVTEQSVLVKIDDPEDHKNKIQALTKALENTEKDYKRKIEAIKLQYDSNIKNMINDHNQGVQSIQNLHEETLQDIIKIHENEVENLRTMSIEAMRKAEKLENVNRALRNKAQCSSIAMDEEQIKTSFPELKHKRKCKHRSDTKMLTKTNVEAFNVKPKTHSHGPCTCSVDINLSDTIRNIFEQVDVEQRKIAEHAYLKYIAKKLMSENVESLDAQELSFLHLKVCRTWKSKLSKEEVLQKRIDLLEIELVKKQRNAHQHIAELDRKVAEEKRRLQEVREAVCRSSPIHSRGGSPVPDPASFQQPPPPPPPPTVVERDLVCNCSSRNDMVVGERRSGGDLASGITADYRPKRKTESNRAVLARLDTEERRERRLYTDEPPTRLRRASVMPARPKK